LFHYDTISPPPLSAGQRGLRREFEICPALVAKTIAMTFDEMDAVIRRRG
jgi:hypothetical protein